ncbi:hypothetical protein K2W90_01125 [Candidatus Babeliales bacterium]|nr:hypothetical protein [Candidatus Babeliales bacterium]
MKRKKLFFLSLLFTALFLPLHSPLLTARKTSVKKVKSLPKQLDFDDVLGKDITPLQFSTNSIRNYFRSLNCSQLALRSRTKKAKEHDFNLSMNKFIKEMYNARSYAQTLSQDGTNIVEFLTLAHELNLGAHEVYVGMRLFNQKLKAWDCELVDNTVVLQILPAFAEALPHYLNKKAVKNSKKNDLRFIRRHTENLLISRFTEKFRSFKKDPDVFLSDLSYDIAASIKKQLRIHEQKSAQEEEEQEVRTRLRQQTVRFLETMLTKQIWNFRSPEGVWDSFLTVANDLQLLGTNGVIDHMDDLDGLLWDHTNRFCYYLDLTGGAQPMDFFDEIEQDLANGVIYFLEADEQDDGIKTKKETLLDALAQAKMKAVAFERGIIC